MRSVKKWIPDSNELNDDFDEIALEVEQQEIYDSTKTTKTTTTTTTTTTTKLENFRIMNLNSIQNSDKAKLIANSKFIRPPSFALLQQLNSDNPISQTTSSFRLSGIKLQNSIYNVENRAKRLNDLILMTYVKSNFNQTQIYNNQNKRSNVLNKVLQDYLTNLTRMQIDDNGSSIRSPSDSIEIVFDTSDNNSRQQQIGNSLNDDTVLIDYQTTTKPPRKSDDPFCGTANDGDMVRDPVDCTQFYTCLLGKPVKKSQCEKGLAFDSKIKVCNWLSEVKC